MLAYYVQMVVTQSGMTIDEFLVLQPREFAEFAGDVLWGAPGPLARAGPQVPTRRKPGAGRRRGCCDGFCLSVAPIVSEDVGEPFSFFTYHQQSFDKPRPIAVPEGRGTPKETHAVYVATLKDSQAKLIELNRPITQVRALCFRAPRSDRSLRAQDDCET